MPSIAKHGNMIKYKYIDGSKHTAQFLSKTRTETTFCKNSYIYVVPNKHILHTSLLSHPNLSVSKKERTTKKRTVFATKSQDYKDLGLSKVSTDVAKPKFRPHRTMKAKSFLYMLSMENHYYKIGYTKNVNKRIQSLQTSSPGKIQIIATKVFPSNTIAHKEAYLKKEFKHKFTQSNGGTEIFKIPSELMARRFFNKNTL
tara:strand:- start:818 stop:1417 length:600 start_codon:yes stop_codon:yes gene_type:complete